MMPINIINNNEAILMELTMQLLMKTHSLDLQVAACNESLPTTHKRQICLLTLLIM